MQIYTANKNKQSLGAVIVNTRRYKVQQPTMCWVGR